jgi:hypothetical protein
VASTVSAQEDEDIEASNEEENPEDSEGILNSLETSAIPNVKFFVYSLDYIGIASWRK